MSPRVDWYKAAVWAAVLLCLAVFWGGIIYLATR